MFFIDVAQDGGLGTLQCGIRTMVTTLGLYGLGTNQKLRNCRLSTKCLTNFSRREIGEIFGCIKTMALQLTICGCICWNTSYRGRIFKICSCILVLLSWIMDL
jgi:hypothetical protein